MAERSNQGKDEELIQKIQEGDEVAFSTTFNKWYGPLVLNACRITGDQSASEDIVNEVFYKLWSKRASLSEIKSLSSYLYVMTRNESLNWMQRNSQEKALYKNLSSIENKPDPTVLEDMIFTEMMKKIYAVMEQLPDQCKKIFIMHYVEGKKITEIAEELQIGIGTVHTHRFRGNSSFKKSTAQLSSLDLFMALLSKTQDREQEYI